MFGDAFSPYLIGALSDSFKPLIASSPVLDPYGSAVTLRQSTMMDRILTYELTPQEYDREFRALEYSLFSCCFFQVSPLSPLHNVYIVQFFSPRPSAVGLIIQPQNCPIIEHIFVPTRSVEGNIEKI